jgi:hypothetical protein
MAAIAKCTLAAMLAATEIDRAVFFRLKLCRFEGGSFMGTIAKGLAFALAARAPIVGLSGCDIDRIGSFLCYGCVVHGSSVRAFSKYSNT